MIYPLIQYAKKKYREKIAIKIGPEQLVNLPEAVKDPQPDKEEDKVPTVTQVVTNTGLMTIAELPVNCQGKTPDLNV